MTPGAVSGSAGGAGAGSAATMKHIQGGSSVTEVDTDILFEQMLAETDAAPEPNEAEVGQRLGDEEGPSPSGTTQFVNKVESAGYVTVYHTETGEPSVINRNVLPFQLKKTLESGRRAFTTRKADVPVPVRGTHPCLLHPSAREPWMHAAGLPTCGKANLMSEFQVDLHMRHRHRTEHATIERRRQEQERQEQRDFQKALLEMASGNAAASAPRRGNAEALAKGRATQAARRAEKSAEGG